MVRGLQDTAVSASRNRTIRRDHGATGPCAPMLIRFRYFRRNQLRVQIPCTATRTLMTQRYWNEIFHPCVSAESRVRRVCTDTVAGSNSIRRGCSTSSSQLLSDWNFTLLMLDVGGMEGCSTHTRANRYISERFANLSELGQCREFLGSLVPHSSALPVPHTFRVPKPIFVQCFCLNISKARSAGLQTSAVLLTGSVPSLGIRVTLDKHTLDSHIQDI